MFDRYIAYQAKRRPYEPAITTVHGDVSYAKFEADIGRFAAWFFRSGLTPGHLVVIQISDKYLHWLVLLALARLGTPALSVARLADPSAFADLAVQLVVTDVVESEAGGANGEAGRLVVTPDWAREILGAPETPLRPFSYELEALGHVATSSGTTGLPKAIGFTWSDIEARLPLSLRLFPRPMLRFLPLIGPETGTGGFDSYLSVWACGGTVIFGPHVISELVDALPRLQPWTLAGAPVQLQAFLKFLPDGFLPQSQLSVAVFGAHTPEPLKSSLSQRVTNEIYNVYGTTEAGIVAGAHLAMLPDPSTAGFICPWVQVEIVDEDGAACADGALGSLRIKAPGCARGYLNDAEATVSHFHEGWFYPGDLGSLDEHGLLRVAGRRDETINVGGEKMTPMRLEAAALQCAGVADAAAFMAPDADGVETAWVAIVAKGEVSKAVLSTAFAREGAPAISLAWVHTIPRNARGKVRREALRLAVAQSQTS